MSETTNLKLFKHDNPETNEEQFDIGNYLNGNWDKIDENVEEVNTEISNIKTEKTELEKELKEMQEDYYQTSIRGQASGEYIHVEDSSGARCKIGISGNSEQETRSGKNLFKPLNFTSNGITTTYDKDGVGTIKGTSTNAWANISANVIYSYPAGNYVLSIDKTKTFNIHFKGIYTDKEIFEFVIPAGSKTKNVAFKKEVYSMYAFISSFAAGTTFDDTIKIQLEKGSTATDFEQYGISPSPDYPSEIKTVGSNVNLLDKSKFVFNRALNNDTGEIRTSTSGNWYGTEEYIDFRKYAGKTISLSNRTTVAFYDTNKKFISYIAATQSPTGTVPQNTAYIRADVYKDYYDVVKLVEGTEVGKYSKYGMGSVKLTKCNKNILRLPEVTEKEINGVKYSIREGKLYLNGIATADTRIDIPINLTLRTGKYTHSRNNIEIKKIYLSLDNINHTMLNNNLTEKTWETTKDTNYTNYLIWFSKTEFNNIILNLQIEESIIATPYKEHQEQSYIMPVQKEMLEDDYFDWDNEEEVHTWNKLVLTGDEAWVREATTSAGYRFFMNPSPSARFNNDAKKNVFCDKLNRKTANETWLGNEGISASKNIQIYLKEYSTKTLDEFKTWLKEHVLTVYYKLATPTRLKFTDDQKSVAKELNNARTYKNVTNITTDSKAILSLDYVKDQETQNQKMQNEIDEIKQLLSTTQTSAMLLDNLQKEVESEVE
ncbi:putative uncharacterized protein [Clostridium sp. CAG:575]|jgi:hypothetical protein|nr:putative uncharacterized protein [Clostridium sp. CAG:575]